MRRSEYIETREGRNLERVKRFIKNIWIDIQQEPGSKKSLSNEGKKFFRNEVKKFLKENNRRAFKSDIVLEIQFFTSQDNPPAIQTLTKNYLDLLHKPMPHIDRLDKILFNDDDQIKLLISNYHFDFFGNSNPKIRIRAYRHSLFMKDIELAQHLFFDRDIDEQFEDKLNGVSYYNNSYDTYLDLLEDEEWMTKNGMEDSFILQKEMHLQQLQESYLKSNGVNYKDLLRVFQSSFLKNKEYIKDPVFQKLWKAMEDFTILSFSSIPLGGAPIASGEKKTFKDKLLLKLKEFKSKHKVLFPLVYPIGITAFYTPPIRNAIDLDNLARLIVPTIVELFNPPPVKESSKKVKEMLPELQNTEKPRQRLPKNAITNYQIINRPRKEDTPDSGNIDLFITDGMDFHFNLWNQIDSINEYIEE